MTALLAPISEAEYLTYPVLQPPTDFTGDKMVVQLNNAWRIIQNATMQPLSSTANTDVYYFPSKYANVNPAGDFIIGPKNLPIISVTTVKWSQNIGAGGWTPLTQIDALLDTIIIHDCPFSRGDYALFQVAYTSGYATIPDDLKECCALVTAHLLSGALFPTQAGASILPGWIPNDIKATIDKYARRR